MKTKLVKPALRQIGELFTFSENNIGDDRHLSHSGLNFAVHSYEIENVGHLCAMTLKAFWGLMTMETIVISPMEKDMPLFNMDRVSAFGKDTLVIEMYDTQLEPLGDEVQMEFEELLARDSALSDIESEPHWYDSIRYPFSYAKAGKGLEEPFKRARKDYLAAYLKLLAEAPYCDEEAKLAKNREYAEKLVSNKGPAVDTMRNHFGDETMRRVVLRHMYGVADVQAEPEESEIQE